MTYSRGLTTDRRAVGRRLTYNAFRSKSGLQSTALTVLALLGQIAYKCVCLCFTLMLACSLFPSFVEDSIIA